MENLFLEILLTYTIMVLTGGLALISWYSLKPKNKKR